MDSIIIWTILVPILIVAVAVVAALVIFPRIGRQPALGGGGGRSYEDLRSTNERLNAENQQFQQELDRANQRARAFELQAENLQRNNQNMERQLNSVAQKEQQLIEARQKLASLEAAQHQNEQRNLEASKAKASREQGDLAQVSARCDEYLARLGDLGPIIAEYRSLRQKAGLDGLKVLAVALRDMAERFNKPESNSQLQEEIREMRDLLRQSGDYRLWVLPMHMLDFCEKLLKEATDGDRKQRELLTQGVIQDIRDMHQQR